MKRIISIILIGMLLMLALGCVNDDATIDEDVTEDDDELAVEETSELSVEDIDNLDTELEEIDW